MKVLLQVLVVLLGQSCLARAGQQEEEQVKTQYESDPRDKRGFAQSYVETSHGHDHSGYGGETLQPGYLHQLQQVQHEPLQVQQEHLQVQQVEVTNEEHPVHVKHVAVPYPVPYAVPVAVPVPEPYAVHVPVHIVKTVAVPVEKPVPFPVEKPVPYPVDKPYPVTVEKKVPYAVPKPYPVHVPIYKIIYKEAPQHKIYSHPPPSYRSHSSYPSPHSHHYRHSHHSDYPHDDD